MKKRCRECKQELALNGRCTKECFKAPEENIDDLVHKHYGWFLIIAGATILLVMYALYWTLKRIG